VSNEPDTWQHQPPQPAANEGGLLACVMLAYIVCALALGLVFGCGLGWAARSLVGGS